MVEINQDLFWRRVLSDLAIQVKADHVTGRHVGSHLEPLLESLEFGSSEIGFRHVDSEKDRSIGMMFLVVLMYWYYSNLITERLALMVEGTLSVPLVISSNISLKS